MLNVHGFSVRKSVVDEFIKRGKVSSVVSFFNVFSVSVKLIGLQFPGSYLSTLKELFRRFHTRTI